VLRRTLSEALTCANSTCRPRPRAVRKISRPLDSAKKASCESLGAGPTPRHRYPQVVYGESDSAPSLTQVTLKKAYRLTPTGDTSTNTSPYVRIDWKNTPNPHLPSESPRLAFAHRHETAPGQRQVKTSRSEPCNGLLDAELVSLRVPHDGQIAVVTHNGCPQ
jgi:hypothetical protein